ncbi:tetratricopeptide repeat protein [Enterovirga rhinocerotis]|uniref:TPR repeat protein n=1 Tax=Enterovirga rhinocerotis TaxID=1339210 RepID=A0A4R7CBZ6_9HYPH|nr:tetratricopeptide repeat protein [Enterovirga rhinocerotis]TDR94646.1 hypothetical protein EV668_1934 [Enterovirga rhinocerotis]
MTRPASLLRAWAVLTLALGCAAEAAPSPPGKPATPAARPPAAATPPSGPPRDLAYGAYQRGYYATARREALLRLEKNPDDVAAMTLLGELYNQGLGVRQDPKAAADWYRLAATRGDPRAMATLGLMALDGRGVPRDPAVAREWLEKAAAKREPVASYNLALTLLASGTDENIARAARLLVVAAEAEIGDAQHALGVMHSRGQGGVAHDRAEAVRMFRRAARNGSIAGEVEYAIALFNGDGVPANEGLAARHFLHAAALGNAIARNRVARLFVIGRGVHKNLVEAAAWHILAKAQGLTDPWLDEQLAGLSKDDQKRAELIAAQRSNI